MNPTCNDEDHDWVLIPGDRSVGELDHMKCRACGQTRAATEREIADSYDDAISCFCGD